MRCAAVMTAAAATVREHDSAARAAHVLIENRLLAVPVVDDDGRFVGMFGVDELFSLVVPRVAIAGSLAPNVRFLDDNEKRLAERFSELKDRTAGEIADRNAVVLAPETPQIEALRIFCRKPGALPVVDANGKLAGIVTHWDVMRALIDGA